MANQYEGPGISVTFACGPHGTQVVEWTVGTAQVHMTLSEYLNFIIPATSEANRRRAMERKRDKRITDRRVHP